MLKRYFFVMNSYMPALAKAEDSLSHVTSASELLLPLASRIGRWLLILANYISLF
jgi:hypothetical protein